MRTSLLTAILLLVPAGAPALPITAPKSPPKAAFNPRLYLPSGSKIPNPASDIVFADLEGNGARDVVIFYLVPDGRSVKPSIMALKQEGRVWQQIWQRSENVGRDFIPPSGVRDILKAGRPQIYSYISVGASCGGLVDVYQYDPLMGAIVPIDGWPKGSCAHNLKIEDLDGDSIPEIIFTDTNYSTIPHVYWWSGERFVQSDDNFPRYYGPELKRLVRDALGKDSPAPQMWGRMAFHIYMLQHRYREALHFCQQLLRAGHSRRMTKAPSTASAAGQKAAEDAEDAIVHRWMGKAYKSLNRLQEARSEYEKARNLDLAAKRLDPYHTVPFPLN